MIEKAPVLILEVSENSSFGKTYQHITARVATIEDGKLRNYGTSSWDDPHGYADLQVQSQFDDDRAREGGPSYGWEVRYHDVYSIDSQRIARMAKAITKVERKMRAMNETLGYADNFGPYVLRFAAALGVKDFFILPARTGYDDARLVDAQGAAYWIGDQEEKFAARFAEAVPA